MSAVALASQDLVSPVGAVHPVDASRCSAEFLTLIPRDFARQHLILSQGRENGIEQLVVTEDASPAAIFNTGVRLGVSIATRFADAESLARAIDQAYEHHQDQVGIGQNGDGIVDVAASDVDRLLAEADRDLLSTDGKGPVVKLVDAILFDALGRRASDIHIQPTSNATLVRYRLDGVLHTTRELPAALTQSVISRIKIMGRMDIAEKRIPQDGRATVTIGARSIDLRISTLPTSYGERAVMRLLDNSQQMCDFESIGMPPEVAQQYLHRATRVNGIILVTGPTGSGKTTTLYATLRRIGTPGEGGGGLNVMTIEDPIEYELSSIGSASGGVAISQSQVNPRKGITFATGLRHILRQDPDVIMVGEIRDAETARIAIQSSLTGHLVFSTLHTNDAPSTITRLIDLGVEPYLISASLSAVLAQRLVRLTHPECSGTGCPPCLGSGFRGRTGLFELMCIDARNGIQQLISDRAGLVQLRDAARASGMQTLRECGEELVRQGRTTIAEVERIVEVAA
jgi:general secretion pathway protein E